MSSDSFDLILSKGHVMLPDSNSPHGLKSQIADVGIQAGKITAIGDLSQAKSAKMVTLQGLHVLPGVIDSQVHFREPGLTHKEDLQTGSLGALLGGITTYFEMPNTTPPTSTPQALEEKLRLAKGRSYCNFGFFAGATPQNTDDLATLELHSGCVGVKIFMGSSTGSLLVEEEEVLKKIMANGRRRVAVHSEDEARMKERKQIAVDGGHARFHPAWRDEKSAILSTERLIRVVQQTHRPAHVLHISTAEELELIAPHRPLMTMECLPQHLLFAAPEVYDRWENFAQQNPPIRAARHREALWKAIKNDLIDVIASDHAPHTAEEKMKPYPQSPSGMPGTQTLLPLMLNFVNEGRLSLEHLVKLVCTNPAALYGAQNKGVIRVGAHADLTIVDLKKTQKIQNSWIKSRVGWCLYDGMSTTGWPVMAYLKGQLAMQDGALAHKEPLGSAVDFKS